MRPAVADLLAGIIDRFEVRSVGFGRPQMSTMELIETHRFFLREGVQWRELRAADGRASGSTLRRRPDDYHRIALLRWVHAVLVRMVRFDPRRCSKGHRGLQLLRMGQARWRVDRT